MRPVKPSRRRIIIIEVIVALWLVAIVIQLVQLQVGQHERLRSRAESQQQTSIKLTPRRGVIQDRNGNELARSAHVKSLYATPADVVDADTLAERLAKILDIDTETIQRRLTSTSQVFVAIKRKLSDVEAGKVEALALEGLHLIPESKRFYVTGTTAAHVIGFVDMDERGMGGIEKTYDKLISGSKGMLLLEIDALKKPYGHTLEESIPGADVTLTIDTLIQNQVEKALLSAVRSTGSRGGTIVVVRPATGEILALANAPTYDPNRISESSDIERRNRAVEVAFEPGSIFKIVTYSAAMEEGLINPGSLIDCGNGQISLPGRIIKDGLSGMLTASQALAKSSNVAAIKIAQRLGDDRLGRYVEAFAFGRRTGIELPAESRGLYRPASEWETTTIGSIPIGYEIGVTAIQAVAAFACIANGGEWIRPYVVSRVTSSSGYLLEETQPERHRVVSRETATTLKAMLEGVVVRGTGKRAQVGGYRAAGKTGTAKKVDPATGRYADGRYIASFVGFAPLTIPEIACIVSLDEPRGAHHGGEAAAPVFAQVVAEILHILGITPEANPGDGLVASDLSVYEIRADLFAAIGDGKPEVADSRPALHVADTEQKQIASKPFDNVVVPNLVGRDIREAASLCIESGLKLKAIGDGIVSRQSPKPGSLTSRNAICRVKLSREIVRKEKREPPDPSPKPKSVTGGKTPKKS